MVINAMTISTTEMIYFTSSKTGTDKEQAAKLRYVRSGRTFATCTNSVGFLQFTTMFAFLYVTSPGRFVGGTSTKQETNCSLISECLCTKQESDVKVNCTGLTHSTMSSMAVDGRRWLIPPDTSILIVEKSDLEIFPWANLSSLHRMRIIQIHHCSIRDSTSLMALKSSSFAKVITNVNLRWNNIQRIDSRLLSIFASVVHLYLPSNEITTIESGCFRKIPKLSYLDLSNNNLGSALEQPEALSGLQQLIELKLENCSVKVLHRNAFKDLKRLQFLYLARNHLSAVPVSTLTAAPHLTLLQLAFNNIKSVDHDFSRLNRLLYLYLHNNGLEYIHPQALDGFDRLKQLVLNNNKLTYLPVGLLPSLQQMPKLNTISLLNVTWHCNCDLIWLVRLEQDSAETSPMHASLLARCFRPSHLYGVPLRDVVIESLKCSKVKGCGDVREPVSVNCELCPPFQRPAQTIGQCVCMEGYEYVPTAKPICQPCPIGSFKAEVSNGTCVRCPANSSTLTTGASSCLCLEGFAQTQNETCEPCLADTFKPRLGNYRCHHCPVASHGPPGSKSVQLCRCLQSNHHHIGPSNVDECVDETNNSPREENSTVLPATDVTAGPLLPSPKSGHLILPIIVGVVLVAMMFLMLVFSWQCSKRLHCRKQVNFFMDAMDPSGNMPEVTIESNLFPHTRPDSKLHIRRMRVGRLLGRGAFGQVHAGVLYTVQLNIKKTFPVAVKRLKDKANDDERRVLQEELEQMLLVGPHPNVIQLIGSCQYEGSLHIIMELAEGGDLLTFLRRRKMRHDQYVHVGPDGTLREPQAMHVTDHYELMLFAWHIAKGMSHLESVKCIHRDLAARNCLLTSGPIAKLSDFGLSRDVYENGYYIRYSKQGQVPYKWMSPEALLWGQYSTKSDVWSYGILLWEMATYGGTPYSGILPDRIADLHRARYRLPQPPACPDTLYRVMRSCWHEDPRKRPTFRTLCEVLEVFVESTTDNKYLELQDQTRPVLPDVTPETNQPYLNYFLSYETPRQRSESLGSLFSRSHQLSLERPQTTDESELPLITPRSTLARNGDSQEADVREGMDFMGESLELRPMLIRKLHSEWAEMDSVSSNGDHWDDAKHGNQEQNGTSGYFSTYSADDAYLVPNISHL